MSFVNPASWKQPATNYPANFDFKVRVKTIEAANTVALEVAINAWLVSLETLPDGYAILDILFITDSPAKPRVLITYGWFVQ